MLCIKYKIKFKSEEHLCFVVFFKPEKFSLQCKGFSDNRIFYLAYMLLLLKYFIRKKCHLNSISNNIC